MQTSLEFPGYNILPNLLAKDGSIVLCRHAIELDLETIKSDIQWQHQKIRMFGRWVLQPRLTAWYGDDGTDYIYSGLKNSPLEWTDQLLEIKQEVESISGHTFNSVLCNLYRNGQDSMGWHQDNEPELGEDPVIVSVSLGESRKFQMRHKFDKSITTFNIELDHGDVLVMSGQTQSFWQHQIPKTKRQIGERINLTFRKIIQ